MSAIPKKIYKFFKQGSKKPGDSDGGEEERGSESAAPAPPSTADSGSSRPPLPPPRSPAAADETTTRRARSHSRESASSSHSHPHAHYVSHHHVLHKPALSQPFPSQDSDVGSEHDNRQPLAHIEELDSTKSFVGIGETASLYSVPPYGNGKNDNNNNNSNSNSNNKPQPTLDLDFDLNIPRVPDPVDDTPRNNNGVRFATSTTSSGSSTPDSTKQGPNAFSLYEALNRSSSMSMRDVLATLDPEARKQYAIAKIQRQARKKNALRAAHAEQQWKMFADLDTQDEAEMLHLAVFMQTLLDAVPQATAIKSQTLQRTLSMEDVDVERSLKHGMSTEDLDSCIRLDAIKVTPVSKRRSSLNNSANNTANNNNNNAVDGGVDFSHREVDLKFVSDLIQTFRNGQRVTKSTVMKILRRVYKMLLKMPNTTHLSVSDKATLTMVGDLHGQFQDLLYILDECGLPSENNKFVFNGDFVDRGEQGLEIVCVLFAMMVAAGPQCVALNRGNHEDLPVCRVYGFEAEVKEKYDELLFEMFAEVFNHLPLFAVVENSVFVVHGGLFHNPQVSLSELEHINRADYFVKPPIPYPQNIHGLGPEEARLEYLKQLQRDALWSDPTEERGCYLNPRGAGVTFGPDIARQFMDRNAIDMVVRSHECCYAGFELPYSTSLRGGSMLIAKSFYSNGFNAQAVIEDGPVGDEPLLCTLFSASNYIGGDNEGAFLQFMRHPFSGSYPVMRESLKKPKSNGAALHYAVHRYKTSEPSVSIEDQNHNSLTDLILRKKAALTRAFEACDPEGTGFVSRVEWAETMQRVTCVKIRWLSIISTVAPAQAITPTMVDYRAFLASFSLENKLEIAGIAGDKGKGKKMAMDDMYGKRKQLETVFYFFDKNGDGVISRDEFREGCELLNKSLHPDCQLTEIDRTLDLMDFDGSGTIDINEFFETFRLLDARDGKVDGVISLPSGHKLR